MAYQTGSAAGATDLLDKLRIFCASLGWTVNMNSAITNGLRVHLQKGGLYVNLQATQDAVNPINGSSLASYSVCLNMSDGYSSGSAVFSQPGAPAGLGGCMSELTGAMPAYHFFAYGDSDDVLVALEFSTGQYQFMGFGKLSLFTSGAFGGAWFFGGSSDPRDSYVESSLPDSPSQNELVPFRAGFLDTSMSRCSSFVRCNVDSNNTWAGSARSLSQSPTALAAAGQSYYDESRREYTPSSLGWQTALLRQTVYINRANSRLSPFGEIKHMRRLEMTNYLPAEEFSPGLDTWKVFPYRQKNGATGQRAIAIRKVV
jgi:hypothetical protein